MRLILLVSMFLFAGAASVAQDSAVRTSAAADTIATSKRYAPVTPPYDSCRQLVLQQVRLNISAPGEFFLQKEKISIHKDWLFYYILGLLLFFGVLRVSYPRYLNDLFRFFFRTSLRVNQIREQLAQSGLQSLLFNIFFALAFGVYVYLVAIHFKASVKTEEWLLPFVATVSLLLLYAGKYFFLKASGWLLNIHAATEAYTFIVFLINKVAGIVILPFLIVLAFSPLAISNIVVTISVALVLVLFLYRFLRAYQPVQAEIKVSRFHFLMYLLAVEVAPLLLIYKLLSRFF